MYFLKQLTPFLFSVLFYSMGFAQEMTKVRGKVIDADTKEPLPFVNVTFLNTNTGTTTDFNGKFQLETKWAGEELQASFVGYISLVKKINLGSNQTINFELKTTSVNLQEIIVRARKKK